MGIELTTVQPLTYARLHHDGLSVKLKKCWVHFYVGSTLAAVLSHFPYEVTIFFSERLFFQLFTNDLFRRQDNIHFQSHERTTSEKI